MKKASDIHWPFNLAPQTGHIANQFAKSYLGGRPAMLIQCLMCDHYYLFQKKCKAFPKGIPKQIYNGKVDHSEPFPDDQGIVFTPLVIPENVDLEPQPILLTKVNMKNGIKRSLFFKEKSRKFHATIEIPLPINFIKDKKPKD